MVALLFVMGVVVLALFLLNYLLFWRRNETDTNRGLQTWQGWDDGHGSGL